MNKETFFKNMPPSERITALRENATKSYTKNVVRDYKEEELIQMKDELSDVDIQMNDAEIEKKEMTAEVNERIKAFREKRSALLKNIKNRYFENEETVYDIDNQEDGMMESYDSAGNLISSRKLKPGENQTTISINQKFA